MTKDDLEILPAPVDQRDAALSLLYPPRSQQAWRLGAARQWVASGHTSLDHLLIARRAGRLVGVCWAAVVTGDIAFLSPPQLLAGEPEGTCEVLLAAQDRRLRAAGARWAQCMLPHEQDPGYDRLRRAGYADRADMLLLAWEAQARTGHAPSGPLQLVAYRARWQSRMVEVIERTYEQTRDFPVLGGRRTVSQVLQGYLNEQGGRDAEPPAWFLLQHAGQDVGCLLLHERQATERWELVYLGLIPEMRGRGWGLEGVRHAQWIAERSAHPRILLGVDAANDPARRIYTAAGFECVGRGVILLKFFSAP